MLLILFQIVKFIIIMVIAKNAIQTTIYLKINNAYSHALMVSNQLNNISLLIHVAKVSQQFWFNFL